MWRGMEIKWEGLREGEEREGMFFDVNKIIERKKTE